MVVTLEITKHLFFNLSLLIIVSFFCLVWFERKNITLSRTSMIVMLVFLTWICIHFSYNPIPEARYDLRIIPIVIGGLYLGVGPLLCLGVIGFRILYGFDEGLLLSSILYIAAGIALWKLFPWFSEQYPKRRIIFSVSFGILLGILTVAGMEILDSPRSWLDAWFAYIVIPPLGIGIISYSIEFINKTTTMKNQLIKTEKLQAVEQMGAAISHEIRNPLTAASGFVQLLEDDSLPRQKQKEYLLLVKDELKAAERVIQDYLTFSKPSIVMNETLDVQKELLQIVNILQPIAHQNSVEILTEFSAIGSGYIKGDRQKFRQCLFNVLKNSVESMPTGGILTILMEYSPKYLTIKVSDTGIGMSKEQLDRLGEPYYSTKGSKGTGLGMMVVFSIVRAMNGNIKVESEVGVGTTFRFNFPLYLAAS